jgi:hypothetical protein
MVTIMETEEMKQKNEEILNRWRSLGLLAGLTEGSINEWRCAKSFDNAANYILNNDIGSNSVTVFSFPFIRRVICTGKKRLHRILNGEEVCEFLTSVTVGECMDYVKKKVKSGVGKAMLKIIDNYLDYSEKYQSVRELSISDFFDYLKEGDDIRYKMFSAIMKDAFDYEAELLSAATDIFVERNYK